MYQVGQGANIALHNRTPRDVLKVHIDLSTKTVNDSLYVKFIILLLSWLAHNASQAHMEQSLEDSHEHGGSHAGQFLNACDLLGGDPDRRKQVIHITNF
jgi:hypothetical protein